ncbi:MAG: ribonuclease H-like domain-containing protein [Thermaerobacterales bacterium]
MDQINIFQAAASETDSPAGTETPDVVFFDLETQRTFEEVGGRDNFHLLGLAVAVVYSARTGEFEVYRESQGPELVRRLLQAAAVVGFNVIKFDYAVLRPHGGDLLVSAPTLDLMVELEGPLGHRIGLDAVGAATLNMGKTADGLQSVRWYREGEIDRIIEYCRADVDVTRRVFEYGLRHGEVFYHDRRGVKRRVEAPWSTDRYHRLYASA